MGVTIVINIEKGWKKMHKMLTLGHLWVVHYKWFWFSSLYVSVLLKIIQKTNAILKLKNYKTNFMK